MMKRRIIKWLAGIGGLCIILVVGLALLLPRLLDNQTVRDQIHALLLSGTNGKVAIKNIDLTWFPRPAVVLRDASLSFSDRVTGTIQSVEVYPSIAGLLMGRLEVSRAKLASPALVVHLPEPTKEPFDLGELEDQIRSTIASLAAKVPGMVATVRGGAVEFKIGERPSIRLTELDGSLVARPGELALQFSSRANVFDSLSIQETIAGDTLVTKGRIKIDRLRLRESLAALFPRPDEYLESGDLSLDVALTAVGLKQIKVEVAGALPSLGLVRQNRKTVIEGVAFKSMISRDEGIVSAVIEQLNLVSPRLTATGKLTVDPASPAVGLTLVGRDLDVSQVRDAALNIAGDIKVVEDTFHDVKGGQLSEVSFQASGQSFAALSENIEVSGTLRDGNIFASVLGIDLNEVNGQFAVSRGILEAKQFSARYGKIQGKDGTLRLGLEGKSAPFHLDLMIDSDAAELRLLLLRVIKNQGFREELSRIRNLEGDLSGRLVLGERSDSLLPEVSVLNAIVKGSYDPVPYPISIKAGRFHYAEDKILLEGVSGAVGLSSFSGLTGSLDYNDPRQIEINSGKFSLDLAQTKNLQNRLAELPRFFGDIEYAQGRLDLTSLSLKGPLDEPSRWNFACIGTLGNIAVKHAQLPAVMNFSGGKFSGSPTKFTFSNAKVNLLDASFTVNGSMESPAKAPLSVDATATGTIGADMTGWLSHQIKLPKPLLLRSPLQVTQGHVLWKSDGNLAFQGNVTVASGPRLSLDLVRGPKIMEVKELVIADGAQHARMTLDLEKDKFAFSFNGTVEQETLERILQEPPLEGSLIQGDIEVSAFSEAPLRFTARGRLAGRELRVPLEDENAVVEFFFLEAGADGINVRSAKLIWRDSQLSLMGKLLADAKALRLDMDISADRVVWEEISKFVETRNHRKSGEGIFGIALPPLEGTVRLTADSFSFARLSWNPLQAEVSLSSSGIKGTIEKGEVCGIGTVGKVDFTDREIALDLSLSAKDGQLEPTTLCLTENRHAISGNYSLQAHIAGSGSPENILQTLRGGFEFSARNGQFAREPNVDSPLEAAFDYLNQTGDFDQAFPDLDRESFPFRSMSSQGRVEGMTLINDELIIQSSLFTIGGNGKIDFGNNTIDARGLVSVRTPGDTITRRIPIVGSILGGSILGIPVRITGSLENPNVTYLSPADVGAELLNIPRTILGIPLEAIRLFTPGMRALKGK